MVTLINTTKDNLSVEICHQYGNRSEELLEILHAVQAKAGYLSDDALRTIANCVNISRAEIHGVVSFYHDYKRKPGANVTVQICRAEACQAVGVNDLIASAEKFYGTKIDTPAKDVKLEAVYCLGNCALGPAIMVDKNLHGRVTLESLAKVVAEAKT